MTKYVVMMVAGSIHHMKAMRRRAIAEPQQQGCNECRDISESSSHKSELQMTAMAKEKLYGNSYEND